LEDTGEKKNLDPSRPRGLEDTGERKIRIGSEGYQEDSRRESSLRSPLRVRRKNGKIEILRNLNFYGKLYFFISYENVRLTF